MRAGGLGAVLVLGLLTVEYVLFHGTLQWRDQRRHVDHQLLAIEEYSVLHKTINTG